MTCDAQQPVSTRIGYRSSIDTVVHYPYECKADLIDHFSAPSKFPATESDYILLATGARLENHSVLTLTEGKDAGMDRVAGFLEIDRTEDTHEIVITHPVLKPDSKGSVRIVLRPRHARHLANLLIENAAYAEAEASGLVPESVE